MNTNLRNRILITILLLIASRALYFIPVPGMDISELVRSGFQLGNKYRPVIGVIGILPYLTASTLVILFIYLRTSLRSVDDRRLPVELYTLAVTAVIALMRGYGQAVYYENSAFSANMLVFEPGLKFRIFFMLSTMVGTFMFVWVARTITKHGIGNGVCLLVLVDVLVYAPRYLSGVSREIVDRGDSAPPHAVGYILAAIVIFLIIVWLALARWRVPTITDETNAKPNRPLYLHVNSVGIVGYYVATTLFGVMVTVGARWQGAFSETFSRLSHPEGPAYWIIGAVVTFLATYWLAALAYDPRGLKRAWEDFGYANDSTATIDYKLFDKRLGIMTTLLTVVVLVICILLWWHAAQRELYGLAAVTLFPMTTTLIDTYRQYQVHRRLGGTGVEAEGLATCVICGKVLGDESAVEAKRQYTCEEHWDVELSHSWATVTTVRTKIEAELCRRRLDGMPTEVFSNTIEPMYGTLGLFDANPITPLLAYRELGGGHIRVLAPASDWMEARRKLELSTRTSPQETNGGEN